MLAKRVATPLNPALDASHVAVVTVSYGSDDVIGPFLSSLMTASVNPLHIVVADNKPLGKSSVIAAMAKKAGAIYLALPSNRGYGGAINAAVRALPAEIEWVVISNPDVTVNPGAIDVLLNSVCDDETIAAVGPRILSADGEVYPSARTIPSLTTGVGHALFADVWPTNPWSRRYRRESNIPTSRRDAGWLSGAFLAVRRRVLDDLAGFDEGYFMYFEDVDLGYRIGKLGLRSVYEPSAVVVHTGAHSTDGDSARMVRAHHVSARRFLSRKYAGPLLLPVRVVLSAGLAIRSRIAERRATR
ncbi:glycosyltransferase [Cryobacterium mannosilyticum]|uniref:Glycosyltransferase family 2 protein n=1 Tax=Cryobacterium mannosilyticum TaxID=1259190 RepID=A0A4R8W7R1_9MICO|nr:glycosyltransferase family 2 protein [Cryobacterium mannosilyticum]TFC01233.1 glycosyltransferase family 2 protein [Cryobacterium mannosilyticum]